MGWESGVNNLLTIREVALRLKLAERTVSAMLGSVELPGVKARGQWRIRGDHLERWLERVAIGRDLQSITRGSIGSEPKSAVGPVQGRTTPPGVEDLLMNQGLKPLTERVSQTELHRRFLESYGQKLVTG